MIQRFQSLLQGILAVLVLLFLHVVHGSTLLLSLFIHLKKNLSPRSSSKRSGDPGRSKQHGLQSTGDIAQADFHSWSSSKNGIPQTLGLIFVPAARGQVSMSWRKSRAFQAPTIDYRPWDPEVILQGMLDDAGRLVRWSMELGVEEVLMYDEKGLLKDQKDRLLLHLHASLSSKLAVEITSLSQGSLLLSPVRDDSKTPFDRPLKPLKVVLLSEQDGKDFIGGSLASGITKAVSLGYVASEDITVDFVQEKLTSSLCSEPDLLIVLGGLHLRLRGFPPWHTRLCEIYHDSSLGLLGPPRLRYSAFNRAMNAYSGCEQRKGR